MTTLMATPTHEQDETDLAKRAIHDIEAFTELYRRNLTRVYRYHIAHVGNQKDAEDLTSQTFIAALEGIRSFRGGGLFRRLDYGNCLQKEINVLAREQTRGPAGCSSSLS